MNFFEMTKTGELVPCSDLWRDGDADLSDVLKRLGFKTETLGVMGLEHIYWMAWYGREEEEGEGHAFIAEWEDSGRIRLILVPDWPTLIKLQALFASIVQTYLLASYMETFSTIACRAFHASHGHDVYKPCLKCDPTEVKRRQTWLERPLKTP